MGLEQRGQMATPSPGSLRVSFTDLLSLSHCPSKDSGAELLRGARHESHPNGIPGIAPGSQVHPASAACCLPPRSSPQQRKSLWISLGTGLGLWDVLTNPLCVILGTAQHWGQARPCVIPAGHERLLSCWKRILCSGRDQVKPLGRAGPAGFKQTP